jgi:hypothetical protein
MVPPSAAIVENRTALKREAKVGCICGNYSVAATVPKFFPVENSTRLGVQRQHDESVEGNYEMTVMTID